ncbi:hypothetical protein D3C73_743720 [compost metagenome]
MDLSSSISDMRSRLEASVVSSAAARLSISSVRRNSLSDSARVIASLFWSRMEARRSGVSAISDCNAPAFSSTAPAKRSWLSVTDSMMAEVRLEMLSSNRFWLSARLAEISPPRAAMIMSILLCASPKAPLISLLRAASASENSFERLSNIESRTSWPVPSVVASASCWSVSALPIRSMLDDRMPSIASWPPATVSLMRARLSISLLSRLPARWSKAVVNCDSPSSKEVLRWPIVV